MPLPPEFDIQSTRRFNAPLSVVWKSWSIESHISQWWGPKGFRNTTTQFEHIPNGLWKFVMHGPGGTDYPNTIRFIDIIPEQTIRFSHCGAPEFDVTVLFRADGDTTWIDFGMRLANRTTINAIRDYAIMGNEQMWVRLDLFLAKTTGTVAAIPFVASHTFDSPVTSVWDAWTSPDHLKQWMVMEGMTWGKTTMDFRRGGRFHYSTHNPDGSISWGVNDYIDIVPYHRLIYTNGFSDPDGQYAAHPMADRWPKRVLNTIVFSEAHHQTTMTVEWYPVNADPSEIDYFNISHDGIAHGWNDYFNRVDSYLKKSIARS